MNLQKMTDEELMAEQAKLSATIADAKEQRRAVQVEMDVRTADRAAHALLAKASPEMKQKMAQLLQTEKIPTAEKVRAPRA